MPAPNWKRRRLASPELLQHYLAAQAEARGDEPAVILGEASLGYAELEEASNRLARLLVAAGCDRGDRVGLLLPKTPSAVLAMHAVLKADCAYAFLSKPKPEQGKRH